MWVEGSQLLPRGLRDPTSEHMAIPCQKNKLRTSPSGSERQDSEVHTPTEETQIPVLEFVATGPLLWPRQGFPPI